MPHKVLFPGERSPALPFPHHLKMVASSLLSMLWLFTVGGAVRSQLLCYNPQQKSQSDLLFKRVFYICGKTGEL